MLQRPSDCMKHFYSEVEQKQISHIRSAASRPVGVHVTTDVVSLLVPGMCISARQMVNPPAASSVCRLVDDTSVVGPRQGRV